MTDLELKAILEDPEFFQENLIPAHSDHFYYTDSAELALGENMPLRQSLNGEWKFKFSPNLKERPKKFYEEDADLKDFSTITVPSNIELQGFASPHYINDEYPWEGTEDLKPGEVSDENLPVGSYVKEFTLKQELKGKRVFISFQGVQSSFRLFVNGKYVCYSQDSFTPAEAELTGYLKPGKNKVAVEVYKYSSGAWLEDQDMWRLFGIFREVYLYAIPGAHLFDLCVNAGFDPLSGAGNLSTEMETEGAAASLVVRLTDRKGKVVFEKEGKVVQKSCLVEGKIRKVLPWSAEAPNLYDLTVILKDEAGREVEVSSSRIGFRTFELDGGVMKLNGKRIIFRGVNRHEFSAENGRALTREDMMKDIISFKKNNINAVRTCHYPNQSLWYRLCDEYGIYMIDETNIETHGTWEYSGQGPFHRPIPGSRPEWLKAVLFRADNMLRRDRNHAAVLLWSLGNESYGGSDFVAMHDYLRGCDPSRLVHYEGVFHNREFDAASDVESRMYAKPAEIRQYLETKPEKPYISCEYMHAMGNSVGGMKLYTDLEDEFDQYQGGFIWDYVDQALYKEIDGKKQLCYGGDFKDRPHDGAFSGDGLVFADRTESPKLCEVKQLYAPVRLLVGLKEILVENRNNYVDLSAYSVEFTIVTGGKRVYKKAFSNMICGPLEQCTLQTGFEGSPDPMTDTVILAELKLKKETKWAEEGHVVAFGEKVLLAGENPAASGNGKNHSFKRVVIAKKERGVQTDNLSMIFKLTGNGPSSLKIKGREYLESAPVPVFTRAYTDNDLGCGFDKRTALWKSATENLTGKLTSFEETEDIVRVVYDYNAVLDPRIWVRVTYEIHPEDYVKVSYYYRGLAGLPELPLLGLSLKLDREMNFVEYFGRGPWENYCDRNNGSAMGIYHTTVEENLTPYLRTQECGNRTDVRYIKLTDKEGRGLCISPVKGTMEVSFLPNSAEELENAGHIYELPGHNYTWVRILAANTGVGGDDSWGAPVHEEFKPDPAKDQVLEFIIRGAE